ncbi:MAG: T9SS type A sorting domain-containing protein, partial [Gemmatimonadetes bacterium]|nr:T9SS type A sorting domain-containing protein [Gemmatimonadota bacterium]
QDLYLANESNFPNHLYRNELVETGAANFSDIDGGDATAALQQSWSASWGDYDNDGDFDLFVANWSGQKNALYRNELIETGDATFSFMADQDPSKNNGWGTGSNWFDWDNDGDVDLLMTNGFHNIPANSRTNWYYRNDNGVLNRNSTHPTAGDAAWSYGSSFGDYDDDGDLDLAIANWQGTGQSNHLYRNEADALGNSWLTVKTVGTTSNGSGIGARIRVRANIGGSDVGQIREITGSDGYCGHQLRAHFGLGDAAIVDSLIVNWPSGQTQVLTNVGVDQLLTITEGVATDVPLDTGGSVPSRLQFAVAPNPFASSAVIRYAIERPSRVALAIYDVAGREVRTLVSGMQSAGAYAHEWDGRDERGRALPSGVYLSRIEVGESIREGRKIVLAR